MHPTQHSTITPRRRSPSLYDTDATAAAAFVRGLIGDATKATLGTLTPGDLIEGYIAQHNLHGDLLRTALTTHLASLA